MEGLSVLEMIQKGWLATYPLIIFSIVTVSIVFERLWSLRNMVTETLQGIPSTAHILGGAIARTARAI